MKFKFFAPIVAIAMAFGMTSCSHMMLSEYEGGHSPMMQMDGEWNINMNGEIKDGVETSTGEAGGCYLNATRDIGGYCQGNWTATKITNNEFFWGIDGDATEFYIKPHENSDKDMTTWTVLEQSKNILIIEREENGVKYHMELGR